MDMENFFQDSNSNKKYLIHIYTTIAIFWISADFFYVDWMENLPSLLTE